MNKRTAAVVGVVGLVLLSATGCASFSEPWNDAPVERKDDSPAIIYSMPDGFANVAGKCDGFGHRLFTTREGTNKGGGKAIAVIADPLCGGR